MRMRSLATMLALTVTICSGCGGGTEDAEPFAIEGDWLFLGPTGPGHEIAFSGKSLKYKGTEADWESNWTIKKYDNEQHQFQMEYDSGHGEAYPSGDSFSVTYEPSDIILSVQLAEGLDSYPELRNAESCTESDAKPIPDCKLYMKQQKQQP